MTTSGHTPTTGRYLDMEPGTGQRWVFIERDEDRGPDMYLGPFPANQEHLAEVFMNESSLIEGEMTSKQGGTDCRVVTEDPNLADYAAGRIDIVIIDHDNPDHTGVSRSAACRFCGHGIVLLSAYTDERWIAPDAGYDSEDGDGIWREYCPDNDTERSAPHEPTTEEN